MAERLLRMTLTTLPSPLKPRTGSVFPAYVRKHSDQRISVTMVEPCSDRDKFSMGPRYVMNACRAAGFSVEYDEVGDRSADVQLVSVHHCSNWPHLVALPKVAGIRIGGGHVTSNNVRPGIPFADAWCIGEGEDWIVRALERINDGLPVESLEDLPGTIVPSRWTGGDVPRGNTVDPMPRHPPYLNKDDDGHARVWYLELARGCPFHCEYCELGWAWKYRMQDTQWLIEEINKIDLSISKRITLFAPDEASHPGYHEILDAIHKRKMITSFGSMRYDVIMRKNLPFKSNMLIRVALDGMTEQTRDRVGRKHQTDETVLEYFRYMAAREHRSFKIFMIFGYPWETLKDFDEFEDLFRRIFEITVTANTHLRVKFTPLIPQPSTPLGTCEPVYLPEMAERILEWFKNSKKPHRDPGWYVANDGLMSMRSHREQVRLTRGDETMFAKVKI